MSGGADILGLDELRRRVAGRVIAADDPAFDEAREIYNAMHERRPAVVVEPEDASGVAHVVEFARSADVPLAVRGGGHSIPGLGSCDDGVMLSLRTMTDVKIDPERRIAHVEGGAIWGQVNDAAHEFGLATPGGLVTHTGVGGFTTGGGFGLLSRAFGLACDNLTGAQVVTADGSVVECGPDREADLFWAIRGGGGNFGVVTRFDFRLHPVRDVVGGLTVFPLDASVIEEYLALIESTPKEFNAYLGLTKALPAPFLPEDVHGTPVAALLSCWSGPAEEHVELLNRITCLGPVLGQQLGPMPYPVINTLFDEILPFGMRHYWKSLITRTVPPQSIATYVEHGRRTPNSASGIFLHPIDGACHDVAAEETAWSHRDADWLIGVYGSWHEEAEDESGIAWVRESHAALKPFSDGSEYVNFAAADDSGAAREIYGSTYPRLAEVKGRYDPDNVFRLNQNVSPSPPRS